MPELRQFVKKYKKFTENCNFEYKKMFTAFDPVDDINKLNSYYKEYWGVIESFKNFKDQITTENKKNISLNINSYNEDIIDKNETLQKFAAKMPKIKNGLQEKLQVLQQQLNQPYSIPSRSFFGFSSDSDGSQNENNYNAMIIRNNLKELPENPQFIEALKELNLLDTFNQHANDIDVILNEIIKVQDKKNALTNYQ